MENPWNEIGLFDYESHMKQESVFQLQAMNRIMKEQFCCYPVRSIMILGIAGGNGLEHIDPQTIQSVAGVDINRDYLAACAKRYPHLDGVLYLLCVDLSQSAAMLPHAELVVANLLIEYIGYACFKAVIGKVKPRYVSCVIQINKGESFVSDSPYVHVFDKLSSVHHQMDGALLERAMLEAGYDRCLTNETALPNGTKLYRLDFSKTVSLT